TEGSTERPPARPPGRSVFSETWRAGLPRVVVIFGPSLHGTGPDSSFFRGSSRAFTNAFERGRVETEQPFVRVGLGARAADGVQHGERDVSVSRDRFGRAGRQLRLAEDRAELVGRDRLNQCRALGIGRRD